MTADDRLATSSPSLPVSPSRPPPPALRAVISDALRYWEWRRIAHNVVLGVATLVGASLGGSVGYLVNPQAVLTLLILAVVANVLYCAAYVPDVFVQLSEYREAWRRRRWLLWTLGTLLSTLLALELAMMLGRAPHGG